MPLDLATARRAAEVRARRYHRSTRPISIADAILIASVPSDGRIAKAERVVITIGVAGIGRFDGHLACRPALELVEAERLAEPVER